MIPKLVITTTPNTTTQTTTPIWPTAKVSTSMQLSEEQYIKIYTAAMQALLSSVDAIMLGPTEIAKRAHEQADAMALEYSKRSIAPQVSQWSTEGL